MNKISISMAQGNLFLAAPRIFSIIVDAIDGNFRGKMSTNTRQSSNIITSKIEICDSGKNKLELILEQSPITGVSPQQYNINLKQFTVYGASGIIYQYP